jgi:predicted permease
MGIKMIGVGKIEDTTSKITWVSPGFFQTLEIPLLDGRDISPNDTTGAVNSAVVNQSFVRKFLSGANPIGRVFRTAAEPNYPETEYEIVGVVRDVKYSGLREDAPPITYVAAAQRPNSGPWFGLTLRSSGQLDELKLALKKALAEVHPDIEVRPYVMETRIRDRLKMQGLMALLSGFFGLLALALSTIGLYGVISYTMARRKNEIGIRMALGATRANVLWLALKECLALVFVGIILGAGITIGLMRLVSTAVFGVGAVEPWTILFAAMLMTAIAALAGYLPARHASRVDPMVALRAE